MNNEPFKEERSDQQLAPSSSDTNELEDLSWPVTAEVREDPSINDRLRVMAESQPDIRIDRSMQYSGRFIQLGPESAGAAKELAYMLHYEVSARRERALEKQEQPLAIPVSVVSHLEMPDGSSIIIFGTRPLFSPADENAILYKAQLAGSDVKQVAQGLRRLGESSAAYGQDLWNSAIRQVRADLETMGSNITITVKQPE